MISRDGIFNMIISLFYNLLYKIINFRICEEGRAREMNECWISPMFLRGFHSSNCDQSIWVWQFKSQYDFHALRFMIVIINKTHLSK